MEGLVIQDVRKVYKNRKVAPLSIPFILRAALVAKTLATETIHHSIEMPSYVVTGASRGIGVSASSL